MDLEWLNVGLLSKARNQSQEPNRNVDFSRRLEPSLPSGYVKIAIENGPFIVDLPIENGDFP